MEPYVTVTEYIEAGYAPMIAVWDSQDSAEEYMGWLMAYDGIRRVSIFLYEEARPIPVLIKALVPPTVFEGDTY